MSAVFTMSTARPVYLRLQKDCGTGRTNVEATNGLIQSNKPPTPAAYDHRRPFVRRD
jgi:hypothetical protein